MLDASRWQHAAMTTELARTLNRLATVMSAPTWRSRPIVLHRRSVTFADRAVVHLLLVLTGCSLLVVVWLLLESRDWRGREPAPEPARDDWADQ